MLSQMRGRGAVELRDLRCARFDSRASIRRLGQQGRHSLRDRAQRRRLQRLDEAAGVADRDDVLHPAALVPAATELHDPRRRPTFGFLLRNSRSASSSLMKAEE